MTILAPLLVALAGALLYGFVDGKAGELGRLAYVVGLFWFVYTLAGAAVHLG